MYLNWMSTASFITLNKRGVKNVFHYCGYKNVIQHQVINSFVF